MPIVCFSERKREQKQGNGKRCNTKEMNSGRGEQGKKDLERVLYCQMLYEETGYEGSNMKIFGPYDQSESSFCTLPW